MRLAACAAGVSVPETEGVPEVFSLEAVMEDYWTPMVDPVPGGLIEKHEGQISPMPAHDGTDCLKWDSYLEPYADHFKVRCCVCMHVACMHVSPDSSIRQ